MAKRRLRKTRWFLLALCLAGVFVAFRQGWVPPRFTPLRAVNLDTGNSWLIDWRLAELRYDKGLCRAVMVGRNVRARLIADRPIMDGCGWRNAVRMSSVGGASISIGRLSCETSAALALWVAHDVQPLAQEMLGAKVTSISHMGTYSCRNIIGQSTMQRLSKMTGHRMRSQHATANAVDIGSFSLANGGRVVLASDWKGDGKKARFLRAIHKRACRYFRVALSPDYNVAHYNHFHFDRGTFTRCK